MPTTLQLNRKPPALDVFEETLLSFHDRDGGAQCTLRPGHISAYRSDVQDTVRMNRGLGVSVDMLSGASIRLAGVSLETLDRALQEFHGADGYSRLFVQSARGVRVRVHHVAAIEQAPQQTTLHLTGGQQIAWHGDTASLVQKITPLPAIEHHEPTELRQSTAAWNAVTEPQPFDPAKTYAQYAVVLFEGRRYSRLVARGLTGVPDVDTHLWRKLA